MRTRRPAADIVDELTITLGERILLDGEDVTAAIRTPEITGLTHRIATDSRVRRALTAKQQELIRRGDWVAEGRDIGTVVAPDAEVKIFLTASLDQRAMRRAREHGEPLEDVKRQLAERDARDETREHGPLVPAKEAIHLDTSRLSSDEVIDLIVSMVPSRNGASHPSLFALTPEDVVRQTGSRRRVSNR
jgi:cytidylate kinase